MIQFVKYNSASVLNPQQSPFPWYTVVPSVGLRIWDRLQSCCKSRKRCMNKIPAQPQNPPNKDTGPYSKTAKRPSKNITKKLLIKVGSPKRPVAALQEANDWMNQTAFWLFREDHPLLWPTFTSIYDIHQWNRELAMHYIKRATQLVDIKKAEAKAEAENAKRSARSRKVMEEQWGWLLKFDFGFWIWGGSFTKECKHSFDWWPQFGTELGQELDALIVTYHMCGFSLLEYWTLASTTESKSTIRTTFFLKKNPYIEDSRPQSLRLRFRFLTTKVSGHLFHI